jgi:hypothetical protein
MVIIPAGIVIFPAGSGAIPSGRVTIPVGSKAIPVGKRVAHFIFFNARFINRFATVPSPPNLRKRGQI